MMLRRLLCGCCAVIFFTVLLLIQVSVHAIDSSTQSLQTINHQPFDGHAISNFLNHRCGSSCNDSSSRPSIWKYEGTLTDPLSGKVIAEVEGLELTKKLTTLTSRSNNSDRALLNNLCTKNILFPEGKAQSSSPSWDTATTILSRKLFCYRRPSSMINDALREINVSESKFSPSKSLLTSIRLRPDGPLRHLSTLENMAIYDSAITYISRNNGREMVVFTELGGGNVDNNVDMNGNEYDMMSDGKKHYIMGTAQCGRDASSFSFATQALKGTLNVDGDHGPMLPPLKQPSSNGSNEVVISPPRSRLLQLGKGDGSSGNSGTASSDRKYRTVRESYSFSFREGNDTTDISEQNQSDDASRFNLIGRLRKQKPQLNPSMLEKQTSCTVKYTRYGEAPPWYAPGRHAVLELRGKRLGDDETAEQGLSPLLSWATSKCKPSFWSGWPTISQTSTSHNEENALAQQAVRLFCNESRRIIQADDLNGTDQANWITTAENTLSRVQSHLKRLSKSFIVSEKPM